MANTTKVVKRSVKGKKEKPEKKCRTVAVFMARIYSAMAQETQRGMDDAAMAHGVKLIYFTSFSDEFSSLTYPQMEFYDKGDLAFFEPSGSGCV